jgi:hypothetical protein
MHDVFINNPDILALINKNKKWRKKRHQKKLIKIM